MCILEESFITHPNGQQQPTRRLYLCERGQTDTPCPNPGIVRRQDQHLPPGNLNHRPLYPQPVVIEREPRQTQIRSLPQAGRPGTETQRDERRGLRLFFDWRLPFCTSRRDRPRRSGSNPTSPSARTQTTYPRFVRPLPARQIPPPIGVQIVPPPPPPHAVQFPPPSPPLPPPPPPLQPPNSAGRPRSQGEPIVLPAAARPRAEGQMHQPRRPVIHRPPVRDHDRRRHSYSPRPVRRLPRNRRHLREDDHHERELAEALLREREVRIRAEAELRAQRRLRQEARDAVLQEADRVERVPIGRDEFERDRAHRYERDRRRRVEIHQDRREGLEDRGERVLREAMRAEAERVPQRRARNHGPELRRWDDGAYEDEGLRGGFRGAWR